MYGTRKQLTHEMKKMFAKDEPLALMIWTIEGVKYLGNSHGITETEAERVLVGIGEKQMDDKILFETVLDVMRTVRSKQRPIGVPADLLTSLLSSAEQWINMENNIAQDDEIPLSDVVAQALADINHVRQLL